MRKAKHANCTRPPPPQELVVRDIYISRKRSVDIRRCTYIYIYIYIFIYLFILIFIFIFMYIYVFVYLFSYV